MPYLYVLNDLRIKRVIVGVGRDFWCAVLEQIFLPGVWKKKYNIRKANTVFSGIYFSFNKLKTRINNILQ